MSAETSTERWKSATIVLSSILAIGSFAVAVASLLTSREATAISRQALARSSGRVLPHFTVACASRHLLVKKDGSSEPDSVLVTVTNDGPDAISRVRLEISMDLVWSGRFASSQAAPPTRLTVEFNGILQKGKSETVDIRGAIVEHLKKIPSPEGGDSFWTACSVVCSAQIVGEDHFASTAEDESAAHRQTTAFFTLGVTREGAKGLNSKPLNFGIDLDRLNGAKQKNDR